MAKNNNLQDFLIDVANAIRNKKGTTALINPQDFSAEIASISGGGIVQELDTSDTTTTTEDVLSGYSFYDKDGQLVSGTIETMAGGTFTSNQVLNTKGKYLTDDIVVNVSGGDTREENDTLAKLKSIDTIMYELRDLSLSEIPRESEYIEQQEIINNIIDTTKFNVTNFINYITTTCVDELKHNLNFKNQHCRYTQYLDSLIGQTSNIGIFGSKQYLKSTAPLTGVTATADKVLLGRLFYDSNGNATFGNITSIIGRDIDINQTLPTAGKYLTDNINILVSSGGKDTNETLKEIIAMDNLLYNLRFMVNQYITSEEYLQQQEFINNTIYEIQGVEF